MMQSKTRTFFASLIALCSILALSYVASGNRGTFDVRATQAAVPRGTEFIPAVSNILQPSPDSTADAAALETSNCRYGVGHVPAHGDSLAWAPTLNAGWYINFGPFPFSSHQNLASFQRVIRLSQDKAANGSRLPTYSFRPPLAYQYTHTNGQILDGVGNLILKNPGQSWIVGNEPDVDNPLQDNTMPAVYARAYHEAYHYIKRIDPTAKVGVAGLSMMTPGRLQYLSIMWDTYRSIYGVNMPVDMWNMHLYILEEKVPGNPNDYGDGKIALGTDPNLAKLTSFGDKKYCPALGAADTPASDPRHDVYCRSEHDSVRIFREQIYAMRQWMKDHGQQNKPLILSEFGLLYPYLDGKPGGQCEFLQDEHQQCFYPERVSEFMSQTLSFLESAKDPNLGYPADENRLVQQWLWYSIITDPSASGGSSNLIANNYSSYALGDPAAMTMMGSTFANIAGNSSGSSNLAAGQAFNSIGYAQSNGATGSATLTASFRNTGTRSIIKPVKVTFYSDQALTKVIGTATYDPVSSGAVFGCTWGGLNNERVSIKWNNLPVGTHQYWAKIDSDNSNVETSEADNVTTAGTVTINRYALFVPQTGR